MKHSTMVAFCFRSCIASLASFVMYSSTATSTSLYSHNSVSANTSINLSPAINIVPFVSCLRLNLGRRRVSLRAGSGEALMDDSDLGAKTHQVSQTFSSPTTGITIFHC